MPRSKQTIVNIDVEESPIKEVDLHLPKFRLCF